MSREDELEADSELLEARLVQDRVERRNRLKSPRIQSVLLDRSVTPLLAVLGYGLLLLLTVTAL